MPEDATNQTDFEPALEDAQLIKAANGNPDAFCLLADRYGRRIYLLAFHYCQNAQDAEDLSQEVWLKAYQALATFRFESSFYTWLRRITINTFLNYRRSNNTQSENKLKVEFAELELDPAATPAGSSISAESIYSKVLYENVMRALGELTRAQRLAFLLRHYEGMSYEEIARAMGCSSGTVKKSVSRALNKLRKKLDVKAEVVERTARFATEF